MRNLIIDDHIEILSDFWDDLSKIYTVKTIIDEKETSIKLVLNDEIENISINRNIPKNQIKVIKRNNVSIQSK